MRVYKYRGANFERDLYSLEKNYYWSPKPEDLNDPCETLINTDSFKKHSRVLAKMFGKDKSEEFLNVEKALHNLFEVKIKGIGIYSLSKTYKDELLWAHYANSHKGFCIEYDLELLANSYKSFETFSFPVNYTNMPPKYTIRDINKTDKTKVVQKLAGHKSKRWRYEQEHRIVTGSFGEHPYEPNCLKSIYFGNNMDESEKAIMMERLKGRKIQFYQIFQKHNSYEFEALKVNDITKEKETYLREIPADITGSIPVEFRIIKKEFLKEIIATTEIEVERKINKEQIKWIAYLLRNEVFRKPKRLKIMYYLKNDKHRDYAWATSHFVDFDLQIRINDF